MQLADLTMLDLTPFKPSGVNERAAKLGVAPAMLWAFLDVEAAAKGSRPDGLVLFRYEDHIHRGKSGKCAEGHPNSPDTLAAAMALDVTDALWSTSWGLPQIMGFNHGRCLLDSPQDLVLEMRRGEERQLDLLATFLSTDERLLRAVRKQDFLMTARLYNGMGQQGYDERLQQRFEARQSWIAGGMMRVLHAGLAGEDVKELQRLLNKQRDPQPVIEDGRFGSSTRIRVLEFQAAHGITADGVVGPKTWAKLKEIQQ